MRNSNESMAQALTPLVFSSWEAWNVSRNPLIAGNDDWTHYSSILPSIGVHYDGIGGVYNLLSATYLFQCEDPSNPWNPEARRIDYEAEEQEDRVGRATEIPAGARGYFNLNDLYYFNYGTSTGLAVAQTYDQPAYWAAWSDSIGYNCLPCEATATFGFTRAIE